MRRTVAIGGWTVWGLVAFALLIPSVRSLTVVRLLTPITLIVAVVAAVAGSSAVDAVALAAPAAITVGAVFTAEFGYLWLAVEGPDVDEAETRVETRVTVYEYEPE